VPAPDRGRVLVSTDGADFQSLIGEVLTAEGYSLRHARSGEEAWAAIGSWRPRVALLDVALPGVPAFELCDRVRADASLRGTGLILIASVFQQTRYKRAPTSLYGADDYIEKHHIRDRLPDKVARLLPAGAAAAAPPPAAEKRHTPCDEREQETLIREELYGSQGRGRKGLESLQERLRRYARIIVSDIALYNQELVERGIREGTFTELLKKEIEEGHRLYLVRVPASLGGGDYYHEAVRDFIAKRAGVHDGGASRPRGKA
jgi:CheY-like chemotaxis protein